MPEGRVLQIACAWVLGACMSQHPSSAPQGQTIEQLCNGTTDGTRYSLTELAAQLADEQATPPPATSNTATLSARDGHSLLVTNPLVQPYRPVVPPLCVTPGDEHVSTLRVCVSEGGTVSDVQFLRRSLPIMDSQLPTVLGRWRFRPYMLEGRPVPFCYVMNYRVR